MADSRHTTEEQEITTYASEASEWHLQDFLSVLHRRRWVSITTFLIVAGAVGVYSWSVTPVYEAHAQLLLTEKPSIVTFQDAGTSPGDQRGYFETQQRILRSRSLAHRVVDRLNLWNTPAVANAGGTSNPDGSFRRGWRWIAGSTTDQSSSTQLSGEDRQKTESAAESAAIDGLLSHLQIAPVRDTRIIEVRYESPDPQMAVQIVNTLTSAYIEHDLEVRSRAANEASAWLADQLAEQRRKVEMSELALQKYRERENSLSLEAGQNIVVQRLNALNSAVTQAKTELIATESLYRQLAASQNNPEALETFPPIRSNNLVQEIKSRLGGLQRERSQLSGNLGARHPEMVRLNSAIASAQAELATEVARTVESVRKDYLAAMSRERDLAAALEAQKANALALNRQGIEYNVLHREVESNRQIFQNLLQRANETAVSSELRGSNIEVVDRAEMPRHPIRPNRQANAFIGLLLSGFLAIAMAFVREAFDDTLKSPSAVRKVLGLPFLGMVPFVSKRALKGGSLLLGNGVPAAYAEAFRALRTNILASAGTSEKRTLLVTSAAPGDGKSMVAVNLAAAIGRTGSRVLLIDADLRRPVLHQLLDCKQRPGLSDVLTGARKPSEAIVATRCSSVWLLPSGTGLSNPSEQLGSKRFKEFLDKLADSFDWVIIDSPPIMAVTDPAVIARMASGVLFVVNARCTQQRVAHAALDRLETAGASFAGVVLNAVALDRDHYYGTRYYLPFYGEYVSEKRSA